MSSLSDSCVIFKGNSAGNHAPLSMFEQSESVPLTRSDKIKRETV